jgi:hypothetical protein
VIIFAKAADCCCNRYTDMLCIGYQQGRKQMTKLDDLKYEINVAVLEAIDTALFPFLGKAGAVKDEDLPDFLPHLERLVEKRLRAHYEFLPESLNHDVHGKTMDALKAAVSAGERKVIG